jgi:hypothetical protein
LSSAAVSSWTILSFTGETHDHGESLMQRCEGSSGMI